MTDKLSVSIEAEIRRVLRLARHASFEDSLDALRVAITWFAHSRKLLNEVADNSGALLEEMRKVIHADKPVDAGRGTRGDAGGEPAPIARLTPSDPEWFIGGSTQFGPNS